MRKHILVRLPPLQATKDISDYLFTLCGKLKEHNVLAKLPFALQEAFLAVVGHWETQ